MWPSPLLAAEHALVAVALKNRSEMDGSGTGLGEESEINSNDGLWGKWLVCNAGGAVSGLSHLPTEGFYEICVNLLLEVGEENNRTAAV